MLLALMLIPLLKQSESCLDLSSRISGHSVLPPQLHNRTCIVTCCLCVLQVRAEITSKEKEEEDMMEKVQKETKYETTSFCVPSV